MHAHRSTIYPMVADSTNRSVSCEGVPRRLTSPIAVPAHINGLFCFLLLLGAVLRAEAASKDPDISALQKSEWGVIHGATNGTGQLTLEIQKWPADGRLSLPTPFPHITAAKWTSHPDRPNLTWVFNANATQLHLNLPTNAFVALPALVAVETCEQSGQFTDGRITLAAGDSKVTGSKANLELHPGNQRIGFWTEVSDSVSWDYRPTRWGMYEVEVVYSADGGDGTEITVELPGKTLRGTRGSTGSWYRYDTVKMGRYYLEKSEPFTLKVGSSKLTGVAVMNLKAVTLRPAEEGEPVAQSSDGSLSLHSKQARTLSVLMRYEPATNKNCLGYWANANDRADWTFSINRPGLFEVEVWQGCGKGHGGSEVEIEAGGKTLSFVVEDTGHFQNFIPRRLGKVALGTAGNHQLVVRPRFKKAGAVMDIREIKLLPVASSTPSAPLARDVLATRRVVFLGDSITYAGQWIEFVETWLHLAYPNAVFDFINMGLPSETVSGLSEPGHAGGAFPRPGLHERLGRVLEKARPDLVVACYGMNDGIYHPFSETRFQAYQDGIRRLREEAGLSGAKLIHLTPPTFDPVPLRGRTLPAGLPEYRSPYEGYNQVLDRYTEWLVAQRSLGWIVLDIHTPMNLYLAEKRKTDPKFLLAGDGVHADTRGHWLIAREFLRALGAPEAVTRSDDHEILIQRYENGAAVLKATQERQQVRKDAWLNWAGHSRPGMGKGKPLPESERLGAEALARIYDAAKSKGQ